MSSLACLGSPIGLLRIQELDGFISEIIFADKDEIVVPPSSVEDSHLLNEFMAELEAYFSGRLQSFSVPFRQSGSDFQQRVWNELGRIPSGKSISYLELAKRLGDVKCIRAAASANGRNKLPILVPCHRVIGKNGSLTGYAGGLWRKRWLLEHESNKVYFQPELF
ncbi:MAG: methylated-DNA--[protein]-cysteine S-methyltransferase [Bacteroidetes bacterium]|nr:MAG: methylated-DNA--[protein]-cysteine S-methyltransferase [Bacteroidota bacterium]REK03438.1 MAG: methylated-DNA--[protein]-cysteine S-methyltransferase [Bacteroidota bacterium]REK34450.1 MAG: methylated-DNA--[protein]-cysteine S-methyltransferase [Bacteroidota bacterium]REK50432.1 MAG: methylated-DNA--[protein]-cysteine S-methyltransferase [Bacteroidota bacterium]